MNARLESIVALKKRKRLGNFFCVQFDKTNVFYTCVFVLEFWLRKFYQKIVFSNKIFYFYLKKPQNETSKGSSKDIRSKNFKMNKSSSEPTFKQNKSNKIVKTDETRKRPKKLKTHKKKTISTNKKNNIKLNIR
jgi:hypothetical protein